MSRDKVALWGVMIWNFVYGSHHAMGFTTSHISRKIRRGHNETLFDNVPLNLAPQDRLTADHHVVLNMPKLANLTRVNKDFYARQST